MILEKMVIQYQVLVLMDIGLNISICKPIIIISPEDNKEDGRSIEIYQEYNKEMIQEIDGWLYTSQNADILPPFAPRLLYSESDSPYKSI